MDNRGALKTNGLNFNENDSFSCETFVVFLFVYFTFTSGFSTLRNISQGIDDS